MSPNNNWYDPTAQIKSRLEEPEKIRCECGCTHFEEIMAYEFPRLHNVIFGQRIKPVHEPGCYVLRCVRCLKLKEPQIQLGPLDRTRKTYERFLDEVNKPLPGPQLDKGLKGDPV